MACSDDYLTEETEAYAAHHGDENEQRSPLDLGEALMPSHIAE